MTARIREFLKNRRESGNDEGPVLVVDLDVVKTNYQNFAKALPDTRVFYAVKANPAPEVLSLLAKLGSCFDTASIPEIEMVLAAGATPDRISYGNTIKKERDIARAYALGVRLYAVDCIPEVEKIARAAGVDVKLDVFPEMQHVWHFMAGSAPEAILLVEFANQRRAAGIELHRLNGLGLMGRLENRRTGGGNGRNLRSEIGRYQLL